MYMPTHRRSPPPNTSIPQIFPDTNLLELPNCPCGMLPSAFPIQYPLSIYWLTTAGHCAKSWGFHKEQHITFEEVMLPLGDRTVKRYLSQSTVFKVLWEVISGGFSRTSNPGSSFKVDFLEKVAFMVNFEPD